MFSPQTDGTVLRRLDIEQTLRQFDLEQNIMRFIGTKLLPVKEISGNNDRFVYRSIPVKHLLQVADTARASGGNYNEIKFAIEEKQGQTQDRGLKMYLDDRALAVTDGPDFSAEAESAQILRSSVLLSQEIRIAALFAAFATYTQAATALWTTLSTDIRADVAAGKIAFEARTGFEADALVVPWRVFEVMVDNTTILDRIKYAGYNDPKAAAMANPAVIAQALNIPEVIIARGKKADQAGAISDIWSNTRAYLVKRSRGTSLASDPGLGRTFAYVSDGAGAAGIVEQWRSNEPRGRWQRVRHDVKEIVEFETFCQVITGVAA